MKLKLCINLCDKEYEEFESKIDFDIDNNPVIEVDIFDVKANNFTNIKEEIKKKINFNSEYLEYEDNEIIKEQIRILNELYKKTQTFFDNIYNNVDEFIFFIENSGQFIEFLEKYPIFNNKPIIYPKTLDLNEESLKIAKSLTKINPNIRFYVYSNIDYVSYDEMKSANDIIQKMIDEVNSYNYSPIEKALHAYDLVRNREYKKADNDKENPEASRDLIKVLNTDNIVCVGFANIYSRMLNSFGINAIIYNFNSNKINGSGHARVLAYIKDDKYKIEGIYAFDPTWDCKKNGDNNFLNSYLFFAKPVEYIRGLDSDYNTHLIDSTIPKYNEHFSEIPKLGGVESITNKDNKDYIHTYHKLARLVLGEDIGDYLIDVMSLIRNNYNEENVQELVNYLDSLRNNNISSSSFLNMLITVRKNENKNNKDIPVVNLENAQDIIKNSGFAYPKDYRLLYTLFDIPYERLLVSNYEKTRKELGKRLIKSLKTSYDKK